LEVTPIVADGILYFATQNQRIVALEPETGKQIWKFDPKSNPVRFAASLTGPATAKTPRAFSLGPETAA
jgi:glucose dehydrogenase